WMRTAKRHDVVASRTFLRTLLHEVVHHLDMCLYDLPNSYHTAGFYRRESSLFRTVVHGTALEGDRPARRADREPVARPAPGEGEGDGIALLRAAAEAIQSRAIPRRD